MLTPCNPCIVPDCTKCEQCRFGYRSAQSVHNEMKDILINDPKGSTARFYKRLHRDWLEQMYESDIIPCPVCGKPAKIWETDEDYAECGCLACGVYSGEQIGIDRYYKDAVPAAIEKWNKFIKACKGEKE